MSVIAFLVDAEEGHLLPTFGLAHSLQAKGHQVVYISILDNEAFVKQQGFGFYPIFTELYPRGFNHKAKYEIKEKGDNATASTKAHFESIIEDSFSLLLQELKPDLFVVTCFLVVEALVLYYRFGFQPVILTPFLRQPGSDLSADCIEKIINIPGEKSVKLIQLMQTLGIRLTSLHDLAAPLKLFSELVLCPRELAPGEQPGRGNTYYTGPSLARRSDENCLPFLQEQAKGRKIIFASLGSQAIIYGRICQTFFDAILDIMRDPVMRDMHLILSTGNDTTLAHAAPFPQNATVVKWISQIDVLKISALAIVHGGLGTIKECIYNGVPMIVVPIARDQPFNARLVEQHGLGKSCSPDTISKNSLLPLIHTVIESPDIRNNINSMQEIFVQREHQNIGLEIIENLLMTSSHEII